MSLTTILHRINHVLLHHVDQLRAIILCHLRAIGLMSLTMILSCQQPRAITPWRSTTCYYSMSPTCYWPDVPDHDIIMSTTTCYYTMSINYVHTALTEIRRVISPHGAFVVRLFNPYPTLNALAITISIT